MPELRKGETKQVGEMEILRIAESGTIRFKGWGCQISNEKKIQWDVLHEGDEEGRETCEVQEGWFVYPRNGTITLF